ncbi:hypothetical protein F4859DRAFT_518451 [Xylaria cf. heliscus]|nr:hypothetical protein F4859DRAFT_518451 [Xylaria cf. heliscus]
MYSSWSFANIDTRQNKNPTTTYAEQKRIRRNRASELINTITTEIRSILPPLSTSEVASEVFRQRGVPSLDMFTRVLIGLFRRSLGYNPAIDGLVRKFIPITRWMCPDVVAILWTVEPVVSSLVVRGNRINVKLAYERFSQHLEWIELMPMTTHAITAKYSNEIRDRWAGWIVWMAGITNSKESEIDSVCSTCNLGSTAFVVSMQTRESSLIYMAMTPKTINLITAHASNMASSLDVTVSLTTHGPTKLSVQPSASTNRNTSPRMFGNASVQFCGSLNDTEKLFLATIKIVKRAMEIETLAFLSSMR